MFATERLFQQLAGMRVPNIIGSAVFGVIIVLAMWPFTAYESADPYADLGDYAGKYVYRHGYDAWPQGPGALCRFRWDTFHLEQEGIFSKQPNGPPVVILGGVFRCNKDLIRERGFNDSPTFVFRSSHGDISQCRLRQYNSSISTYDPGLYSAKFRQECWLYNFVSEDGQLTEVWIKDILLSNPIPNRSNSSS